MKVSINAPVTPALCWLESLTSYHLIVSRYLSKSLCQMVVRELIKRGDFVTLDNYDEKRGDLNNPDTFVHYAIDLRVSEVIVPDKLFDLEGTWKLYREFKAEYGRYLKQHNIKICGVVQGMSEKEVEEIANRYISVGADTIAVPDEVGSYYEGGRIEFVTKFMRTSGELILPEIHMLGVYNNPLEIAVLSQSGQVRSLDTTSPIWCGLNDIQFNYFKGTTQKPRKKNPDEYFLTKKKMNDVILYNIGCIFGWSRK